MSKRNGRNKARLEKLDEINQIDRRMKRVKNDEEERSKLLKKRELLRNKLKTNRNGFLHNFLFLGMLIFFRYKSSNKSTHSEILLSDVLG